MNDKVCARCRVPKPELMFAGDHHQPDGLKKICRDCFKPENAKQYRRRKQQRLPHLLRSALLSDLM